MNSPVASNVPDGYRPPAEQPDYDYAELLRLYSAAEEISDFAHNLGCDYKLADTELAQLIAEAQVKIMQVALHLERESSLRGCRGYESEEEIDDEL